MTKRCEFCGEQFTLDTKLSKAQRLGQRFCSQSCGAKARVPRVRYPELQDHGWLETRYVRRGLSAEAIAAEIGATGRAVLDALVRVGIPVRTRGRARHGHTRDPKFTPTYRTWKGMIQRCHYPPNISYHNYGARGITVCDRWRYSFDNFLADMGERPEGKTLDRIDNDGNYEPGNCRWATRSEQRLNTRARAAA